MQHNSDVIISDTSRLIILDKIDELELLRKMGRKVFVIPIILKEKGGKNENVQLSGVDRQAYREKRNKKKG